MPENQFHTLKNALETHHKKVVLDFQNKHANTLKKAKLHGLTLASTAIMAGSILSASPPKLVIPKHQTVHQVANLNHFLAQLNGLLTHDLNSKEEGVISQALSQKFNVNLTANLQGHHLNEIYGFIGAEQHLKRWSGDALALHDIQRAGIAPRQGSFGDFDNADQEKYYVAVQLHLLPDWNANWSTLKPWYRYRKVLVYNPDNQKAVVAVIGDSGPAKFTGKTFGGSPEVMQYLNRFDGQQKGKVVILFIDDPEDKIPLGPIKPSDLNIDLST